MPHDYYSILGVPRSASIGEIKKAYRRLSKELHPDKTRGDASAEARYKDVNEAYEVLGDPAKKKMYDQFGAVGGPAGGGGFDGFDFSGFQSGDFGNLTDLFESFFGGGGFGATAARRGRDTRGEDIEVHIALKLADVVKTHRRAFNVQRFVTCFECDGRGHERGSSMEKCSECGGTGQVTRTRQSFFGVMQQSFVCPACSGAGEVPKRVCRECGGEGRGQSEEKVEVEIPAGVHDGQTLRLQTQGSAGRRGGSPGDLYVHLRVDSDPRFEREEDDLRSSITVSALDAILGTTVKVETIHGNVELTVPEGTQPGQVLRLKGKGMPVLNTSRHGDHYVTVHVEIPKKLSRKEREILGEWRKIEH